MGKVLQRVTALCGDRPQLGKLDKNTTGEILAGFFTVTGKNQDGKPMEGLAIVYAPKTGTAGGAVLLDDADRFPSTVNAMFARLKQELGAPANSSAAPSSAAGSGALLRLRCCGGSAKAGPPQPLQPVFPDGTGVIGLPAGWQMLQAQMGDVYRLRAARREAALRPDGSGDRSHESAVANVDGEQPRRSAGKFCGDSLWHRSSQCVQGCHDAVGPEGSQAGAGHRHLQGAGDSVAGGQE